MTERLDFAKGRDAVDDIIDSVVQGIEENAFPYFFVKPGYRKDQYCASQHMEWLEKHLNEEEKAHFVQLRDAELRLSIMEREALIKLALAAGIRLALPR